MPRPLRNRSEAGQQLAERLLPSSKDRPIVLALPRGGVPVGFEIAQRLGAPLDVLIVRKVGAPGNPEYGLGAVGEGGVVSIDRRRARDSGYDLADLEPTVEREVEEVRRRVERFRGGRPLADLSGRTAILVDDGVATGGTVLAGIQVVRALHARRVVVALGVCPGDTLEALRREADEVVSLLVPTIFFAVGEWYRDFEPVDDSEVDRLLALARVRAPAVP
ncbi:MAG TPA: phosphoribosyltransferase family protein [Thermoplasmata archaeon]|nr:phosphoribosyltransferase family protein [Thermoplasmata archaeon]